MSHELATPHIPVAVRTSTQTSKHISRSHLVQPPAQHKEQQFCSLPQQHAPNTSPFLFFFNPVRNYLAVTCSHSFIILSICTSGKTLAPPSLKHPLGSWRQKMDHSSGFYRLNRCTWQLLCCRASHCIDVSHVLEDPDLADQACTAGCDCCSNSAKLWTKTKRCKSWPHYSTSSCRPELVPHVTKGWGSSNN